MKYYTVIIIALIILVVWHFISFISSFGAGTHGGIIAYCYPVNKHELEKAVDSVLEKCQDVKRSMPYFYYSYDSVNKSTSESIDSTIGSVKVFDSAYNDGKRYITINIAQDGKLYDYSFQYSGYETDWDTAKNSVISVTYAWDDNGNGGSDGHGDFNFKWGLKRRLTKLFEDRFIERVDKQLGKHHTKGD